MTEEQIVQLISDDTAMMDILGRAGRLGLPNWLIGAGFVRGKVWDHLHGWRGPSTPSDIDLVYFDPGDSFDDDALEARLSHSRPTLKWDVKNQATAHRWNGEAACMSVVEALARWPETATAVGVTTERGPLELIAPHGIADLVGLIVRPTPAFNVNKARQEMVRSRFEKKRWQEKWPRLRLELSPPHGN